MSLTVFAVVLFAAALHATWNAVIKGGRDTLLTTAMVAGVSALLAVSALPFLPPPAPASWPLIGISAVLQTLYFVLLANAYRVADMSQTYPLMRGVAPLIVAAISAGLLREPMGPFGWLGVLVVCGGVLSMAAGARLGQGKGVRLALLNAVVIAGYTLIDGWGVRHSGSPAAYTLWIFFLTGIPIIGWALARRATSFGKYVAANWGLGLFGGIGTASSYGLALWAMTAAPVAVVAALRETSIVFGTVISVVVLREQAAPMRIAAACVIAAGAMALRLA